MTGDETTREDTELAAEGLSVLEDALSIEPSSGSLLSRGEIPREFDGFVLEECVGIGGMGEVYRARQPALERDVALKVRVARACDPELADRLIQSEARHMAELHHPGIARVFATGQVEGRRYSVIEYVDGSSLAESLQNSMPLEQALRILLGIARALSSAHARGLAHRDLKPSNVMIAAEPADVPINERVVLVDFGLAGRLFKGDGVVGMGTRRFMAPEQLAGQPAGPQADVFALLRVFERITDEGWLELPRRVRRLLRSMGAHDPAARPKAMEIAAVIERALDGGRRSRGARVGIALAVLALAAAGLFFGRRWWSDKVSDPPALEEPLASSADAPGSLLRQFRERRDRYMSILAKLRDASATQPLPISETELAFLRQRLPVVPQRVYAETKTQLGRWDVQVPARLRTDRR